MMSGPRLRPGTILALLDLRRRRAQLQGERAWCREHYEHPRAMRAHHLAGSSSDWADNHLVSESLQDAPPTGVRSQPATRVLIGPHAHVFELTPGH
jgi:hypothetical protein